MDNVTHALFGAALAEAGLKRWTPRATATLIIGANLPDLDVLAGLEGEDFSLWFRRGWTHGVLAQGILAVALAGVMFAIDRRYRATDGPRARFGRLLVLSLLSIASHTTLDWLNNYGVRLLMPFDGRWFYGDSFFIIDPWLWLAGLTPCLFVHSVRRRSLVLWGLLTAAMSALVVLPNAVSFGVKAGWVVGLTALWAVRALLGARPRVDWVGRAATAVFVFYGVAMWSGTALAERQARSWLAARGDLVEDMAAMPMAGNPFVRDVVVASGDRYLFLLVDWWADETVTPSHAPLPRSPPPPPVRVALARPELRGFANWLRFPSWTVETTEDGYDVRLDDVRYSRFRPAAFGRQVKVLRSDVPNR